MVTQWYSNYSSIDTTNWNSANNIKVSDTSWATNSDTENYINPWGWSQTVAGDSITGIEVRIDCKSDDASANNYFEVELSWDNGSSWTTPKRAPTSGGVGTSENVVYLGGASDDWGHTPWTFSELSTNNFQIRAVYYYDSGTTGSIDYFAWRAHSEWSGGPWQEENQGSTDADDGTEEEAPPDTWNWYNTGYNWNNIGYYDDSGTIYVDATGITFRGVDIPSNVIINEAIIKVAAYGANSADLDAKIWGVDVDDFAGFDGSSNAIHTLAVATATDAKVDWDVPGATSWSSQNWYDTPDIKSIIQEIVDRGGWAEGNDIGIAMENDEGDNQDMRSIYDSGYSSGGLAAILLVNYSVVDGNSAKANIEEAGAATYEKDNSAKAQIVGIQNQGSSAKADMSVDTFPLTDNFGDASIDQDKWRRGDHATEASVEEDGVLKVQNSTATTSGYVRTRHQYTAKYSTLEVKVNQHGNDGGFKLCPTDPAGHQWDIYSENDWYNHQLTTGPALSPNKRADGVGPTQIGGDSPTLTVPYWVRMRIDDSTIYFDYKDNLSDAWINISSETWSLSTAITSTYYAYMTGYNTQTTGVPHYDDFNWQDGVQTEKNNTAKANIVRETPKANSSRGNLSTLGQQYNYAKANIFVADVEQNSSSKASIYRTETSSNKSLASILITQTQDNSAIADIFLENLTQNNFVKARIIRTDEIQESSAKAEITTIVEYSKNNSTKTNILRANEIFDNSSFSSIFTTPSSDNLAKGNIIKTTEKDSSSRGNLLVEGQQPNYAKANVLVTDDASDSSAKANIFEVVSTDNSVRANLDYQIVLVEPADTSSDLAPTTFVWRIPYRSDSKDVIFWLQVDDTDDTFNSIEANRVSSHSTGFEYWDGDSWEPIPAAGVSSAYYGNNARIELTLTDGNKYWRVQGGAV
jgi:hypothetical protein